MEAAPGASVDQELRIARQYCNIAVLVRFLAGLGACRGGLGGLGRVGAQPMKLREKLGMRRVWRLVGGGGWEIQVPGRFHVRGTCKACLGTNASGALESCFFSTAETWLNYPRSFVRVALSNHNPLLHFQKLCFVQYLCTCTYKLYCTVHAPYG